MAHGRDRRLDALESRLGTIGDKLVEHDERADCRPSEPDSDATERLLTKLLAVGQRLLAVDELPDESEMSVAERVGVALVRGEYEKARSLLQAQVRRIQANDAP
jgi:hypothetical protein